MSKNTDVHVSEYSSPQDLRRWLRQEMRDIAKASELRLREATEFVMAYAAGEITPEEADERSSRYHHRWDEALPGVSATDSMTDEQILTAIDATRAPYLTRRRIRQKYEEQFGKGHHGDTPRR